MATLAPYLPRLVIEWAGNDPWPPPSTTHRVVDGSLLFADISGFTALSERLAGNGRVGAEELTETLSRCFGDLLAVAYDAGGSLLKFGGDALLLLFQDNGHAERACASALRMRAGMGEIGRVATSVGRVRLRMSIGVHSGDVHLFRVGRSHRELIVTGPAATATVDMESAASADQIVVSPATAACIDGALVGAVTGPGFLLRERPLQVATGRSTGPVGPVIGAALSVPVALRDHLVAGTVESEHRTVSIAFVHFDDVDGLLSDEGAAGLADALDELVTDVQAAADEHGVTFLASDVDRNGGKIILVSGAPRAVGDDEGRMLRCLHQIASGNRRLPVRIGVNHGHVFVGEVGPSFRRTYTVMGDAVNLAARLMAKAEPGQILATASVVDRSATVFDTVAVAPFTVKGKSQSVEAFIVGDPGGRRAGATHARTPLAGREAEMATLIQTVDRARAGAGALVEIVGAAGMGKSRLVEELVARADGFTTVRAFCEPYEAHTPYYACRFLLRAVTGATNGPELQASVERVAPGLLPWLPLLATVADVDVAPTEEASALDPRYRRQRTQRVVVDFLRALVADSCVFVVEDGQWLDGLSAELLGAIGDAAADRAWLVCVARRDDVHGPPPPDGTAVRLHLAPLDVQTGHALLSDLSAGAPLRPHERDALVAQAGGNPLFLAELVRARAGSGVGEPLPESLEAVVAAQIDRLDPADRRVLRWMSVLGPVFDVSLLDVATDGRVRTAAAAIRRFGSYVQTAGPGLLRFSNECYRQVSYEALPFRRRRELHAIVGDALERATVGREGERAAALSLHFLHAQRHDRCWKYALLAAAQARASYANAEAVELYQRALSVRRHVGVPDVEVAKTWEALGDVSLLSGSFEEARVAYRRARPLRAGDVGALAHLCSRECSAALHQGRNDNALRWLRKGLRLLEGHDGQAEVARRADLRSSYAHCRQQSGRPREALRWSQLAVEDALLSDNRPALARSYLLQDWALMALGRTEQATNAVLALPICEELGDLSTTAEVLLYLGNFAYMRGRWDEALDLWTRASDAYQRTGNTVDATFGACNSAEVLVHQGRYDEAEPRLRDALEVWQSMGYAGGVADVLGNLGRLALVRGELDEAVQLFEEVRALFADACDAREVGACGALAECLLRKGSIDEALTLIDGGLRREKLSGDTEFAAMLHRLRGYAHVALGRTTDAWADFDESLAVARGRGAAYEVALTLEALSVVAELGGLADDPSRADERAALLEQLGVRATPPPPLPLAA
jgi:class 3 adenylate cyclase/tetratricopeptide (TPR) repeat protein